MPPTAGLDDAMVGRFQAALIRLARLLRHYSNGDMTPTAASLFATIVGRGPMTLGELAAAEQVAPPTVTKVVGELEAAGLVERRVDSADRRVYRVQLTEAAVPKAEELRAEFRAWMREQLATLSADELARLAAAIDVLEHLSSGPRREPGGSTQRT